MTSVYRDVAIYGVYPIFYRRFCANSTSGSIVQWGGVQTPSPCPTPWPRHCIVLKGRKNGRIIEIEEMREEGTEEINCPSGLSTSVDHGPDLQKNLTTNLAKT